MAEPRASGACWGALRPRAGVPSAAGGAPEGKSGQRQLFVTRGAWGYIAAPKEPASAVSSGLVPLLPPVPTTACSWDASLGLCTLHPPHLWNECVLIRAKAWERRVRWASFRPSLPSQGSSFSMESRVSCSLSAGPAQRGHQAAKPSAPLPQWTL